MGRFTYSLNKAGEYDGIMISGRNIVLMLLGVASIIVSVCYSGYWLLHNRSLDLPSYYVAGLLTLNGLNPYDPDELCLTAQQLGLTGPVYPYIYFPIIALVFMPLSLIKYNTVQLLWFGISQFFFWFSIALLAQITYRCFPSIKTSLPIRLLYLIPLACLSYPLVMNFQNGQVNTIMLFLICAFLYQIMTGAHITAGLALALVIMIKPQPAIIIPYLLYRKHIRCAVSSFIALIVGTGLTALVVGWDNFCFYLTDVLPSFSMIETRFPPIYLFAPPNQSIAGIVSRIFQNTMYTPGIIDRADLVRPISSLLLISVVTIGFIRVFTWNQRRSKSDHTLLRDCSYLLVMSILLSPITWDHHLIMTFSAGVFLMFDRSISYWKSFTGIAFGVCWVLMAIPLNPFYRLWTVNGFFALGTSLKGFALLGFWGLMTVSFPANKIISLKND